MGYIIIGGDLAPVKNDEKVFVDSCLDIILDKQLIDILTNANYRVFNLELPLTDAMLPINKTGPNLKCNPKVINGIKRLNVNLVTLANNHIMDFGIAGLRQTCEILNRNNIDYLGIGQNLKTMTTSYVLESDGHKIGIYACAENEFSIATEENPGANGLDLFRNIEEIKNLRRESDYVVVLLHAGIEYHQFAAPYLKKITHSFVDAGANLVLCQHSHCIGKQENYKEATIIYGQGNFIFNNSSNSLSKEGILVGIDTNDDFRLRCYKFKRVNGKICFDSVKEKIDINSQMGEENAFVQYVNTNVYYYLYTIYKWPRVLRFIDKKIKHKLIVRYVGKKRLLFLLNIVRCEAHSEILTKGLENIILENKL